MSIKIAIQGARRFDTEEAHRLIREQAKKYTDLLQNAHEKYQSSASDSGIVEPQMMANETEEDDDQASLLVADSSADPGLDEADMRHPFALRRVLVDPQANASNDTLLNQCCTQILMRAYRDQYHVKAAHFLSKRGVTWSSIGKFAQSEALDFLGLPTLSDFGPLVNVNLSSGAWPKMTFNGQTWADTAGHATSGDHQKEYMAEKAAAPEEAIAEEAGDESMSAASQKAAVTQQVESSTATAESLATPLGAAEAAVAQVDASNAGDDAAKTSEEEQAEALESDDAAELLGTLMSILGPELAKVRKHEELARAAVLKLEERWADYINFEAETPTKKKALSSCTDAWNLVQDYYRFHHHADKVKFYSAPAVAFVFTATNTSSQWIETWMTNKWYDLADVESHFEDGDHAHCSGVCYGCKEKAEADIARYEAKHSVGSKHASLPPEYVHYSTTGKAPTPMDALNYRKTSLANDPGDKEAVEKANDYVEKLQALYEIEVELNELQETLKSLYENQFVGHVAQGAKKMATSLNEKWHTHQRNKGSTAEEREHLLAGQASSDESPPLEEDSPEEAPQDPFESPRAKRFKDFVMEGIELTNLNEEKLATYGNMPFAEIDYGKKSVREAEHDIFPSIADPADERMARMLLHVYSTIEHKDLWRKAKNLANKKADSADGSHFVINAFFIGVGMALVPLTGGGSLVAVAAVKLGAKLAKKATFYANESRKEYGSKNVITKSLDKDSMDVLEAREDFLQTYGEKIVQHFIGAMKNVKRIERHIARNTERKAAVDELNALKTQEEVREHLMAKLMSLGTEFQDFVRVEQQSSKKTLKKKDIDKLKASHFPGFQILHDRLARVNSIAGWTPDSPPTAERLDIPCAAGFGASDGPEMVFNTCDEAAAYAWAVLKFQVHYEKYAYYSLYLIEYVGIVLRRTRHWEERMESLWGKEGLIRSMVKECIHEDAAWHSENCSAPSKKIKNSSRRGRGGPSQVAKNSRVHHLCYGPPLEENLFTEEETLSLWLLDDSSESYNPRMPWHPSRRKSASDAVIDSWEKVKNFKKDYDSCKDKLEKKIKKAEGKVQAAKDEVAAAQEAFQLAKLAGSLLSKGGLGALFR